MTDLLRFARLALLALAVAGVLALTPGRAEAAPASTSTAGSGLAVGAKAVRFARRLIGVPYRYGGSSPRTGFDCSGLVRFVYDRLGIDLPRTSYGQFARGRRVARRWLKPGDLVFFDGRGHVGLYVGRGRFVHAPRPGLRVKIDSLGESWYRSRYDGARRLSA